MRKRCVKGKQCVKGKSCVKGKQCAKGKSCTRTSIAFLLVAALSAAFIPHALALSQETAGAVSQSLSEGTGQGAPEQTAVYEKSETVYASLSATGAPEAVYVVNRFDVQRAGTVVDYGDYTSAKNLTDETALKRAGNAVAFDTEEGVFYYQGNAAATTLPWNIVITYELDGKKVAAEELAGATGSLAIHIDTTQNGAVDSAFFESFMLQITLTLDGASAGTIKAEGATVASSGKNWTVAFTALPGREDSFELTAQVKDFSMDGAQIAALPYTSVIDAPDTGGLTDDADELVDAVSRLAEGTASLAAGASSLAGGARDLSQGTTSFGEGLRAFASSSSGIVQGSADIEASLASIAKKLADSDLSGLGSISQLPANLRQIAGALEALAANAGQVREGYASSLAALEGAMSQLVANAPTESEIAELRASVADDAQAAATVEKLVAVCQAAQAAKGTWDGSAAAFAGADELLAALSADAEEGGALALQAQALYHMADALEASLDPEMLSELGKLAEGISQLASEYSRFHKGLISYAEGASSLAANYCELESGTSTLAGGAGSLASGAKTMNQGMAEFDAQVSTLPQTMRERIGELMADYDFPEFDPVSFTSAENGSTVAVQFVMTTPAIEKPEAPAEEEPAQPEQTIWDRFLALFRE